MAGFCSQHSKLEVLLIAKDEKQISLRMSLTKALYAVHTPHGSDLHSRCGMMWYRILGVNGMEIALS